MFPNKMVCAIYPNLCTQTTLIELLIIFLGYLLFVIGVMYLSHKYRKKDKK